jgi:hypothetical protein
MLIPAAFARAPYFSSSGSCSDFFSFFSFLDFFSAFLGDFSSFFAFFDSFVLPTVSN